MSLSVKLAHTRMGLMLVLMTASLDSESMVLAPVAPGDTQACYDYSLAGAAIKDCITLVRKPGELETKIYRFRSAEAKFYSYRAELAAESTCADHSISISRRLGKPKSASPRVPSNARVLSERHLFKWRAGQISAELECLPGPDGGISFLVMNGRTPGRIQDGLLSHASAASIDPAAVLAKAGPWVGKRIEELSLEGRPARAAELLELCRSARNPSCQGLTLEHGEASGVAASQQASPHQGSQQSDSAGASQLAKVLPTAPSGLSTEASVGLSENPREIPSSWLICDSQTASARQEKNCLAVPVGPEGMFLEDSALARFLAPLGADKPPSIAVLKLGDGACREVFSKYRESFGKPRRSAGDPLRVPPTGDSTATWRLQGLHVLLECQTNPNGAEVSMKGVGDVEAGPLIFPKSIEGYLEEKLKIVDESVLDSIDEISRLIGTVPARAALDACADSGNAHCLGKRDAFVAAWGRGPVPALADAPIPKIEIQRPQRPASKSLAQGGAKPNAASPEDRINASAQDASQHSLPQQAIKDPPTSPVAEYRVPQPNEVTRSCAPQTRFSTGIRVVKVGCDVSVVLRRGQSSGRHIDVIVEIRNASQRDETVGPGVIAASSGGVLTYEQAVSRIKRGTFGESFGRFLVGAVEVWGASGSSTTSVSSGQVSGHVDGTYVSGRYTATTIDFGEGKRRSDAAIDRASADFEQIEREGEADLAGAEQQYLRPHTLAPGEGVVRYVTLKMDKRLVGDETFRVKVATRDGSYWVDL